MSARIRRNKTGDFKAVTGAADPAALVRRHLRIGWWSLLVYLTLGILLESLHGFKAGWYLNVSNSTRRLMLTLAHAHGTLLGLLHIAFAATISYFPLANLPSRRLAANCLVGAGVLIPAGFLLGGLTSYAGETGLGIILVPAGALLLVVSVVLTAKGFKRASPPAAVVTHSK
jgi:hypothetical protein